MSYRYEFDERRASRPRKSLGLGLLLISAVALLGVWVFPTPYVIEQPGPTYNVLGSDGKDPIISIAGAKTYKTSGNLDLLTVQVVGNRDRTPGWFEIFLAWMDPSRSVLLLDQVFPANQTTEESQAESSAMMEQSQQEAIAVALRKLNYTVPVELYVSEVSKNSPSSGKVVAADFIRTVNGVKVQTIEELRAEVNKFNGKTPVDLVVSRAGADKTFELKPIKDESGAYRLGLIVGYKYEFPVDVTLKLADVGGPSGGMMFALAIYDKLTPGALTGGNYIAGTGTIDAGGQVGPIGGIQQKMFGAANAGAKFFLAPSNNCDEVIGHEPEGLKVFSVKNFDEALKVVDTIGQGKDTALLATCSNN